MTSIEQGKTPAELGMCLHGNFPGSCPACSQMREEVAPVDQKRESEGRQGVDREFMRDVRREFDERNRENYEITGKYPGQDFQDMALQLSKLGDPKLAEELRSRDIAPAFIELHNIVIQRNDQQNETFDPEARKSPEQARLTHETFLKAGEKLYPHDKISAGMLDSGMRGILSNLEGNELLEAPALSLPSEFEFQELLREDPESLIQKIEQSSRRTSERMRDFVHDSSHGEGFELTEEHKEMIDSGARALYMMEQMIDAIRAETQHEITDQKSTEPQAEEGGDT